MKRAWIAIVLGACASPEAPIEFELPPPGSDGGVHVLGAPPTLRSPFDGSERITSHVTHGSGASLTDYACRPITRADHKGTDFGVPVGTPVHAAAAGTVIRRADGCAVGNASCGGGFGNHVVLLHTGGRATLYAHLTSGSGIPANGAMVGCGDLLGQSGNTGRSTGPHLHFEVRDGVTDVASFFAAGPSDPFGGACSSQAAALWSDGDPGPTCSGASAAPRDDSAYVSATFDRRVRVRPGEAIVQRFTLRNSGTTTWTPEASYGLRFVSGDMLGAASPVPVTSSVAPGGTSSFEVRATAPASGTVRSEWRMAIGDTGVFGATVFLEIEVSMPAMPRGCRSQTLGREVADGDCVQVGYGGCGATSCGWYACNDGSWQCTDGSTCRGMANSNSACAPVDACANATSCGACTVQEGCAWCGDRCVAQSESASCASPISDPAACASCAMDGAVCRADADCCGSDGSFRCVLGFCTDTSACHMVGASCLDRPDCCGAIICSPATLGGASQCCLRAGDPCASASDCCGAMLCTDGHCACRELGESCADTGDCCGGMICNAGSCGF